MAIREEFQVHLLNDNGITKAREIAQIMTDCLDRLEAAGVTGRELKLCITKAQEMGFFAKRSIAMQRENQQ